MTAGTVREVAQGQGMADALKSWTMVVLTLVFVFLYGAALVDWLKPLTDEKMVLRLEPIIFVVIGYYFGRLPGQQIERTLKDEMGRQTQKADAAQHAKEQALQSREAVEEKLKNVNAALTSGAPNLAASVSAESHGKGGIPIIEDSLRHSAAIALKILNS